MDARCKPSSVNTAGNGTTSFRLGTRLQTQLWSIALLFPLPFPMFHQLKIRVRFYLQVFWTWKGATKSTQRVQILRESATYWAVKTISNTNEGTMTHSTRIFHFIQVAQKATSTRFLIPDYQPPWFLEHHTRATWWTQEFVFNHF